MTIAITTHVLDTELGRPGIGINVRIEIFENNEWIEINSEYDL